MGLMDKVRGMFGQHADKVEDGIDKGGDFIDDKYADQVDKGQDAAKDALRKLSDTDNP